MASQPDETGDDGKRQEIVSADDRQHEIAGELIELQRELIELQRERNELARDYLKLSQQEAQLDYDLSSKELDLEDEQNKRAYRLAKLIIGGFALVLFLLLYMVFYGSEAQADKAEKLLIGIILLLGGASLRDLIGRAQKRLINR